MSVTRPIIIMQIPVVRMYLDTISRELTIYEHMKTHAMTTQIRFLSGPMSWLTAFISIVFQTNEASTLTDA